MNKKKPTKKLAKPDYYYWDGVTKTELKWIHKIAHRACERDQKIAESIGDKGRVAARGVMDMSMDLELCHAKHHKLRLKEMAETKDNFSFMHDIYMIVNSINKDTYGWDTLGVPRFSR